MSLSRRKKPKALKNSAEKTPYYSLAEKRCSCCKEVKNIELFNSHSWKKSGKASWCKNCEAEEYKCKVAKDPTKYRHIWRQSAARKRAARREQINEYQRELYRANFDVRERKKTNRAKREPHRGISSAVESYKRGDLSFDGLNKLIDDRIAFANEAGIEVTRGRSKLRHAQNIRDGSTSKRNSRATKNKS